MGRRRLRHGASCPGRCLQEPGGAPSRQAGSSLISLLLVLVVLAILAVLAVAALPDGKGPGAALPTSDMLQQVPDQTSRPGVVAVASSVACMTDVAALEQAMAAAQVTTGSLPASVEDLLADGFVSDVPARPGSTFAVETAGGQATGRILVNGLPAAEGCH